MTTNDSLEKLNGNNYEKVNNTDSITEGTYRLRYLNSNQDAYVIAKIN